MSSPVIAVTDLEVVADRRRILNIRKLHIASSEVIAVLGPNGAGKSTLLRVLLGWRSANHGVVRVLGEDVLRARGLARARLRRRVGYVPQETVVDHASPLTVREVVAIGRTGTAGLFRPLRTRDWNLVDTWLARMELLDLKNARYAELSGGERRKVLLARVMVQEPQLLLLDEPTAFLDLAWRERIVTTLDDLYRQTGVTTLLVCHELEVLPPSCRRVVLLRGGECCRDGTPEEALTDESIEDLYGSRMQVWHGNQRHALLPIADGAD